MLSPVVAGLMSVLFGIVGVSSSGAESPSVLTETEFLAILTESHPAVVARRGDVAAAQADVLAASTLANPGLDVVREAPSGGGSQVDLTFSWALPRSSRKLEILAAEHDVEAAVARLEGDVLSLRRTLRRVYADWAVATARGKRLATQQSRILKLADRERARAERGESSQLEVHRLDLAVAGLAARRARAEAEALKAYARVRGWAPDLPADATPILPSLPPPADVDGSHPRLLAAAAELLAAESAQAASRRFLESPEVVVGWQRQDVGVESVEGPLLGLTWSLPLFRRNQAESARAGARAVAARARLERVRQEIEAERAGAVAAYRLLAVATAEVAVSLEGNEKMLAGAVAAFHHGEASLTDLLETLRSMAESEMTALDLQEAALAAHRDLESLAGRSLDPLSTLPPTFQGETP
jgi:outer membrane protein TolC